MTDQGLQFPRFYVTAPSACPYIDGKIERKVFTELAGPDAHNVNEALSRIGFRRSQSVAYRPACENCAACISVRVVSEEFCPSTSQKRILKNNRDIKSAVVPAEITDEHYALLKVYLEARHQDGSMADMTYDDFQEMVESSTVDTFLIEYRETLTGALIGLALTDEHSDGLSMVYSLFDPKHDKRSMGSYMILDHITRAQKAVRPYIYLGYWIEDSRKMSYKEKFQPLEKLGPDGWYR
ncbi:arginyltransferase [Temperatibacter marinus]|uniref:Aspartate/glutamate leucyltransferase n=1 Tax=Temperatibacter marinus TaxID=1456591 RepID=A0AA52H8U6_9PROT|nr:arginyltransferase [Temperatibacter marinus]WND02481.1 arginyltransferase [Temperatibacter marinus]